ncbi:MAG: flagellar hook capping FlgD N-terminal domain-containing protein [Myxococcota bacterium]
MGALDGVGIDSVIQAAKAREAKQDAVGQNQFLEMLVAQLENQDPLNPQDSADFAAQLAQFSTVEQLIAMRSGIDKLVAAFSDQNDGETPATAGLDPASLVGREVVVFGSQIEVDEDGTAIELPLRNAETAVTANVRIFDSEGRIRYEGSLLQADANGRPIALRPGDHSFDFDPRAHNLPEGVYRVEFSATGTDGEPVTILPMVTGVVTGAVVAGQPAIRMGNRLFSIEDILEVRLAPGSGGSSTAGGASETGGGQTVLRPTGRTPGAS